MHADAANVPTVCTLCGLCILVRGCRLYFHMQRSQSITVASRNMYHLQDVKPELDPTQLMPATNVLSEQEYKY